MSVKAILLGAAQDAGVPHMACNCSNCVAVKEGCLPAQYAVSMGLVDASSQQYWLIDCSPDIKYQYDMVQGMFPECKLQGVLLTHLHMGHYIGLFQFGKEAANQKGLKVYGTPSTCAFFRENQPWVQYITAGNIQLVELQPDTPLRLTAQLTVTPVPVPHRQEYSDTVAYYAAGPARRLFYCPDIDSWDALQPPIQDIVAGVDVALLDACFFSPSELRRRDMTDIPHPLVPDTLQRLASVAQRVVLIHLNHTNPLWRDGPERDQVQAAGMRAGRQGEVWAL